MNIKQRAKSLGKALLYTPPLIICGKFVYILPEANDKIYHNIEPNIGLAKGLSQKLDAVVPLIATGMAELSGLIITGLLTYHTAKNIKEFIVPNKNNHQ